MGYTSDLSNIEIRLNPTRIITRSLYETKTRIERRVNTKPSSAHPRQRPIRIFARIPKTSQPNDRSTQKTTTKMARKVGRSEGSVFVSYRALQDTYVTPNRTDITVCLRYVRIPVDPINGDDWPESNADDWWIAVRVYSIFFLIKSRYMFIDTVTILKLGNWLLNEFFMLSRIYSCNKSVFREIFKTAIKKKYDSKHYNYNILYLKLILQEYHGSTEKQSIAISTQHSRALNHENTIAVDDPRIQLDSIPNHRRYEPSD